MTLGPFLTGWHLLAGIMLYVAYRLWTHQPAATSGVKGTMSDEQGTEEHGLK